MFVSGHSTNAFAKVGAAGKLYSIISRMSEMLSWRSNQGKEMLARPLISLSLFRFLPWKRNVHTILHRLFDAEQFSRYFGFLCNLPDVASCHGELGDILLYIVG